MAHDTKKLGSMENVITPAYRAHMEKTIVQGICPLCSPDPSVNVVLRRTGHWQVWKNPFAYEHHDHHFIIASIHHIDDITKLTHEMWASLGVLIDWVVREYKLPGGGLVMRFGEPEKSASTLRHLHMHIQVPDGTGPAFAVFCGKDFKGKIGDCVPASDDTPPMAGFLLVIYLRDETSF